MLVVESQFRDIRLVCARRQWCGQWDGASPDRRRNHRRDRMSVWACGPRETLRAVQQASLLAAEWTSRLAGVD